VSRRVPPLAHGEHDLRGQPATQRVVTYEFNM
jgi:hypothetical protein